MFYHNQFLIANRKKKKKIKNKTLAGTAKYRKVKYTPLKGGVLHSYGRTKLYTLWVYLTSVLAGTYKDE
jgi:hypothetical protein